MTAQRQEGNGKLRAAAGLGLGIALIAVWAVPSLLIPGFAAHAATTGRVVVNRFSGLAIEGFDPVAYFIDGRPVLGSADFEASQEGAVWRFHNEGNRASFVAHPEVYAPQFGGYDPVDVARGVTFAGNPRFWAIAGERLYLFGLEAHRDAFAADPENFLRQAQARWPKLEQGLAQ
jgi:YHS domain-containing protein